MKYLLLKRTCVADTDVKWLNVRNEDNRDITNTATTATTVTVEQ